MLFVGCIVWRLLDPLLGLATVAAGEFLLMSLVADALCPAAYPSFVTLLKRTAALVCPMALLVAAWRVWM